MTHNNLHLNLAENAYDFLENSLELFIQARSTNNQKYWKYTLLNIIFCIELLLKERLRREHPLLLIQNMDKYRPITRESKTVSWNVSIERLKNILGEDFIKMDSGRLNLAHKIRNQILHYDVVLEFPTSYHTYANLMNFVGSFYSNYLASSVNDYIGQHILINPQKLDEIYDDLGAAFGEELVFFNNIFMEKDTRATILEEQENTTIIVEGKEFNRIVYGDEAPELESDYAKYPCHDCLIIRGQIHTYGCDVEVCPRCKHQLITCNCVAEYKYDKEHSDFINTIKVRYAKSFGRRKDNTG